MRGTAFESIGAIGGITGSCMLAIVTHRLWPIVFDCGSRTAVLRRSERMRSIVCEPRRSRRLQSAIRRERSEQSSTVVPDERLDAMSDPIFTVQDAALDDLRARLQNTRWPLVPEGQGWARGTDLAYLRQLVAYWRTSFDWRAPESG